MKHLWNRHANRHVVITGAGTGIGRAIALRVAAEGARLTLMARTAERLEETAEAARDLGARDLLCLPCDIRDLQQVNEAFDAARDGHGTIHALVANSGVGGPNEVGPEDRFLDLVQTNLVGTYWCLRAAQRHLAPRGGTCHLVVIASILARIGVAGYTGYCASKAGLMGLVRALAAELAPDDVQVNAVCPGWVNTQMAQDGIAGMAEGLAITEAEAYRTAMQAVPMGRMSEPEEIAGLVAWLISADARGVTGQGIDINGGALMV